MKERVQELKADKADGESAVLAKIAEMPEPDRAVGKRLHAIIKASAPALSPVKEVIMTHISTTTAAVGTR